MSKNSKTNVDAVTARRCYIVLAICIILQALLSWVSLDPGRVEQVYSKEWYAYYSFLPKVLFGWVPFSVGDVFYLAIGGWALVWLFLIVRHLFRRRWRSSYILLLKALCVFFMLYLFFYVSWGMQYYRQPLAVSYALPVEEVKKHDYYAVLEKYIAEANRLRRQLDVSRLSRDEVGQELEGRMKAVTPFDKMLSKAQVKVKHPLSSTLVSYFMVTGYFNPFTHEVHVNKNSPLISYPFTTVHELAHQMGVGFEDECNFIAFRMLIEHENLWYRYSAYYEAIQSLLRPIRTWDQEKSKEYYELLDQGIKADLKEERDFWMEYYGAIEAITGPFYNAFLQHNNQPEGTERYSMMNRLVIAWELSGKETL